MVTRSGRHLSFICSSTLHSGSLLTGNNLLTISRGAGHGISSRTLTRWINEGIIDDVELRDRNGWKLFSEEEIKKLKAEANRTSKRK